TKTQELVALYNALTPGDHPKVEHLTDARRRKAAKVLRQFPERAFWVKVCAEISASPFLRGQKPREGHTSFRGDFDWLLTTGKDGTENCIKTYEGRYTETVMEHAVAQIGASGVRLLAQ